MGVEVDEPIQMGMIQRALANAALSFTKKTNQVRWIWRSISRFDSQPARSILYVDMTTISFVKKMTIPSHFMYLPSFYAGILVPFLGFGRERPLVFVIPGCDIYG